MDVTTHRLVEKKIIPEYFDAVKSGVKCFELRKDEDDIQPDDVLLLKEWDVTKFTGNIVLTVVTYVLRDAVKYGLMNGYCIIGFNKL